jgi:hypothetical protein
LEFRNIFKWFINSILLIFCYQLIIELNWLGHVYYFFISTNWAQHTAGSAISVLSLLLIMGRRICYEINSSSDKRSRCVLYFILICDLQDALDDLWDSLNLINTHASASRVVHLKLLDSSVDHFVRIRASGVAGDLDGGSLIGWVRRRRFTMRSLSTVTDQRLMRWITMNVITNCCSLVQFGTDEFIR